MSVCRTVSEIFSVKEWRDLDTGGRWSQPFDRYDFLLVSHSKYSCMLYYFQVIWRWIIVTLKRSLKVIQTGTTRKIGCGFLFPFRSNYGRIFIFNRLWDIHRQRMLWPWNWVRGRSMSLKMAPFDRSYTTFYWSAIVCCTIFKLFDVQ